MERAYFTHRSAARRYRRHRPDHIHALVLARMRSRCGNGISDALDVACGTGQSTVLLADLARNVVGIDMSAAMLEEASSHDRVRYETGLAERMAFPARSFDLVTTALAFHWFDREAFLDEAARVLRRPGWLVVYTNGMTGRLAEQAPFTDWFRNDFLARYPGTPRNAEPLPDSAFHERGYEIVAREQYLASLRLSLSEIVGFLLTQSNVIARVELGEERIEDATAWVSSSIRACIGDRGGELEFEGSAEFFHLT